MKRKRKPQKASTPKVIVRKKKDHKPNYEKAVIIRKAPSARPKPKPVKVKAAAKPPVKVKKSKAGKKHPNQKFKKVSPVQNIPYFFRKYVYKLIEDIMPPIPWKIGIQRDLVKRILYRREFDGKRSSVRRLCEAKLSKMVYEDEYLQALIKGRHRHGFGGVTEPILDEHRQDAIKRLNQKIYRREKKKRKLDKKAS